MPWKKQNCIFLMTIFRYFCLAYDLDFLYFFCTEIDTTQTKQFALFTSFYTQDCETKWQCALLRIQPQMYNQTPTYIASCLATCFLEENPGHEQGGNLGDFYWSEWWRDLSQGRSPWTHMPCYTDRAHKLSDRTDFQLYFCSQFFAPVQTQSGGIQVEVKTAKYICTWAYVG